MEPNFAQATSENLPEVNYIMIQEFFAKNMDYFSVEFRSAKNIRASRAGYGDEAIGYVQVKRDRNICTVEGQVVPEHRVHQQPYSVTALFDEEKDVIISCQCESCAASQGGAAELAGLHAGDKIIKVNGVNVTQSTHTQVVALIKSSREAVLTVQQRLVGIRNVGSPSVLTRPVTTPTSSRITGPQPVDNEKQQQLQLQKEQYYRLMIEKEQNYVDQLRSQIASSPDEKKFLELAKTEKNLQTLQEMLVRSQSEQRSPSLDSSHIFVPLLSPKKHRISTSTSSNGNSDTPPPLPKRNVHQFHHQVNTKTNTINNKRALSYINGKVPLDINFFNNETNSNIAKSILSPRKHNPVLGPLVLDSSEKPPPLPPRAPHSAPLPQPLDPDAVNSINKQMSYPLVATCATLVNNYYSHRPQIDIDPAGHSKIDPNLFVDNISRGSNEMSNISRHSLIID